MSRLDEFEHRQQIVKDHSEPDPYEEGAYTSCIYDSPMQWEAGIANEQPCPAPERPGNKPDTCRGCFAANFEHYNTFMEALRALLRNK